jgi:hypothetical protein
MNRQQLRTLTDLGVFFPRSLARALHDVIQGLPPDSFEGRLLSLVVWEPDQPVDLRRLRFFAVYDDTSDESPPPFTQPLESLLNSKLGKHASPLEVDYVPLSTLVTDLIAGVDTTRKRISHSIVLYDQETIIPLKALAEMQDEWGYGPFHEYMHTIFRVPADAEPGQPSADDAKRRITEMVVGAPEAVRELFADGSLCAALAAAIAKFGPYVEACVIVPPSCHLLPESSAVVIVNDTDVSRLQRIELKLKIQGILISLSKESKSAFPLNVMLLTEVYDLILRRDAPLSALIHDGTRVYDNGVWGRLGRLMSRLPPLEQADRDAHIRTVWNVWNVPLWLAQLLPNIELRGYEKRRVKGAWGLLQRVTDWANRHELKMVAALVWVFVISVLASVAISGGWFAVKLPLALVLVVPLVSVLSSLVFRGLVNVGLGRYSPFIMPLVLCGLWATAIFGVRILGRPEATEARQLATVEVLRTGLTNKLAETTREIQDTVRELDEASVARGASLRREIAELERRKLQLVADAATLDSLRGPQTDAIGRAYGEILKREMKRQDLGQKRWDILVNVVALILGAALGQLVAIVTGALGKRRTVRRPLQV